MYSFVHLSFLSLKLEHKSHEGPGLYQIGPAYIPSTWNILGTQKIFGKQIQCDTIYKTLYCRLFIKYANYCNIGDVTYDAREKKRNLNSAWRVSRMFPNSLRCQHRKAFQPCGACTSWPSWLISRELFLITLFQTAPSEVQAYLSPHLCIMGKCIQLSILPLWFQILTILWDRGGIICTEATGN